MVTIRQTQLIPLMKKAGYAAVDSKGTCNGIACVAAQSFLLQGNLDAFSKRLDFIEKQGDKLNENFASIKGKFNKIGEARKKHQPITPDLILTNEEKAFRENYIDVMAFYDSVRLYQAPHEFRNLFNRRLEQQHTVEVAQFTSPLEINSKPNAEQLSVAQVGTSINVYSANEVKQYFQDLQQRLDAAQENIALLMGPPSHAISVLYDAKNRKWTIADANTEGMVKSISADLPYMLAQEVLATAYNMNNKRDEFDDLMSDANKPNFLLGITALSRSDKASEMTDLFNQFLI
jgi:hypothetical protein